MQAGLAEILVGLDELCAVLAAQKHSAWRKQHEEEAAELRKEAEALNVHLAQMKQTVQKTEDPAEGPDLAQRLAYGWPCRDDEPTGAKECGRFARSLSPRLRGYRHWCVGAGSPRRR